VQLLRESKKMDADFATADALLAELQLVYLTAEQTYKVVEQRFASSINGNKAKYDTIIPTTIKQVNGILDKVKLANQDTTYKELATLAETCNKQLSALEKQFADIGTLQSNTQQLVTEIEKNKDTFSTIKQDFATKIQSVTNEITRAIQKAEYDRLSQEAIVLATGLNNEVAAIHTPLDAAQHNIENIVNINSSMKNITNQLDSQDKNTELLSNILSTSDNNQTRQNIIKLRETIVPDKETFHHLQDELLLTSTVNPHTAQEVTATALLTELNQLKSQVDTANHLSTTVLDNQHLNTTITSSDELKDNITQLNYHIHTLQQLKNDNYPSAISNATRITTACHDYIQAAPAKFGVIHQEVEINDALVNPALEQAKTVLSSKLTEVTAHNTKIPTVEDHPEVRAALEQRKNTLLQRINEQRKQISPGSIVINKPPVVEQNKIDAFIEQYDAVYDRILNSDVLSDEEKQVSFAMLNLIRDKLNEINLSKQFADLDENYRAACAICLDDMTKLTREIESNDRNQNLTNKAHYQAIVDMEERQLANEKGVESSKIDHARAQQTVINSTEKLIQKASKALDKITNKITSMEAEQSTFSKFISRGFNALTKGAAVGASAGTVGVSAAAGALVGGTIGASFFGIGAIPGAIIGAVITGTLATAGMVTLAGLGWFAAKSASSSNRETNIKEDKEFKQHLQSLVEPGSNQATQTQAHFHNQSSVGKPTYLEKKSEPTTDSLLKDNPNTNFAHKKRKIVVNGHHHNLRLAIKIYQSNKL
ncbi:MAG: hypothetical protein ACK4PR_03020, partial [Gammaproteobacteria bacterium]